MRGAFLQITTLIGLRTSQGKKTGRVFAERKGIPHNNVDLPPIVSIEASGNCIPIGKSDVLLVEIYKSPSHAWND
jgi:hypothetical protein